MDREIYELLLLAAVGEVLVILLLGFICEVLKM